MEPGSGVDKYISILMTRLWTDIDRSKTGNSYTTVLTNSRWDSRVPEKRTRGSFEMIINAQRYVPI